MLVAKAARLALLSTVLLCACGDDAPRDKDTSDTGPELVFIESPSDGDTFVVGATVELVGRLDPAAGLSGARARWSSDKDGLLAELDFDNEQRVTATVDTLTVGAHLITLAAEVDGVVVDEAVVAITVVASPGLVVSLSPASPTPRDPVVATVTGATGEVAWSWTRDGASTEQRSATLPALTARRGEVWVATATDAANRSASASVTFIDAPPSTPTVVLGPELPTNGDILTCLAESEDPDGDALSYAYVWTARGQVVPGATGPTLAAYDLVEGDEVTCSVTASANGVTTAVSSASISIFKTLPRVGSAAVARVPGPFCPSFTCLTSGLLPEGTTLSAMTTTWELDGAPWEDGEPIPDGAEVACVVRVTDGLTDADGALRFGPPVLSPAFIVTDTPPTLHGVAVYPSEPLPGDVLRCEAVATDAECPDVELDYAWTVDGAPLVTTNPTLDTAGLSAGQVVECRVTALAGGQTSSTARVTLREATPGERRIILRAPQGANGPITCEPNGEVVAYPLGYEAEWIFEVGGVEVQRGESATLATEVSHCDLVACRLELVRPGSQTFTSNRSELVMPVGPDCADNDLCTADLCAPTGGCLAVAAAIPCNDGSFCTLADACQAGSCAGQAIDCDDGDPCTNDLCHPVSGCYSVPATGPACDDGQACTTGDTCRAGVCLGQSGCGCQGPADCDDGNACTADTCEAGQCRYAPLTGACDDGDACTSGDLCVDARCQGNPVACDTRFFDGDGDTYGIDLEACACEVASDSTTRFTATRAGDCDDGDARVFPGSAASLVGVDADCSGWVTLEDGSRVPSQLAPPIDNGGTCVPTVAPLGFSLAPLTATELTFSDCGGFFRLSARGPVPAAGGATWVGTGAVARNGVAVQLAMQVTSRWQAVAPADYAPGFSAVGGEGTFVRRPTGAVAAFFESAQVCVGNCCEVRQTGGCTEAVTESCVVEAIASCANTWSAACVAKAAECTAEVAKDYSLSERRAALSWDGERWRLRITGRLAANERDEPVWGLVGCQDPDVRACACEESSGCCDQEAWGATCELIAETTCGDVDGRRCGGFYFVAEDPLPDFEPLDFLSDNAFWFRGATAQVSLFPAGNGGTELVGVDIARGRVEVCLWPYTDEEAALEGRTCREDSLWVVDGTAEYRGGTDFFLRARAKASLIPIYDDRFEIALTLSSDERPNADDRSVMDVLGTPGDPTDDVHVAKGIQTTGYYQLPWAIPDVFTGEGRLLDSVVSTWSWNFDLLTGLKANIAAKVPIEVDLLPRNLIPGIQRLSLDSITWRGELTIGVKLMGAIVGGIKSMVAKVKSMGTNEASGSAGGGFETLKFTLESHAVAKLQPIATTCRPWNKGYSNEIHQLYCPANQPTSAVWYFDGDRNSCVFGVPPRVNPTDLLTGESICQGSDCGSCVTALDCGAPWTFGCESGRCTCRNDPRDDIYPSQAACEEACPAQGPIVGVQNYALTFLQDGSLLAQGDVYLNGRWIEPFGLPNVAFENPAITLGLNLTTLFPVIGYSGDVYYRPSTAGGAAPCEWPINDPRCDDLGETQACDPAGEPCPSGESCVCPGDGTCEVGVCIPNVCIGETFAGDNCLVHGGISTLYIPKAYYLGRLDLANISAGNMMRLFGDLTSGLAGIVGVEMNPDVIENLAVLDPDLRDAEAFARDEALALNEVGAELAERGWDWADSVLDIEHLELYFSTVTGSAWNVTAGPGFKVRADFSFQPLDPLDPPLVSRFTGSLLTNGPEKGLKLTSYLETPTPTALMRDKLPGLTRFRLMGDPYAKEARMVAGGFGLEALGGFASLDFSRDGTGTVELYFEPRPLGSFDYGLIVAGDEVRGPQEGSSVQNWWAAIVVDPEDPSRARIEAGYWGFKLVCSAPTICLLAPKQHVVRTVNPVLEDSARHHLALVFEDETVGIVLDGVERKVELVEGEEKLNLPTGIRRLRVGGAIVGADDVRVWRRARSSAEIEAEASYLPPGYQRDADLVARWEMDWDDPSVRDGSNRVLWRNSKILSAGSLDGFYRDGAEPVAYDTPTLFQLTVAAADGGTGFYTRGGYILDDEDGSRMWAMRSATGLREGPNGTEASLELYLHPIRIPLAAGTLTFTGDGPNGLTGDYDDGVYLGADALSPFIEGNLRATFAPLVGSPVLIGDWRMTFGCPDDEPGCDDLDKELQFGGPLAVGLGLPEGMVLELQGGGRLEGDNVVANGRVELRRLDDTGPRIRVADAEVTVGASKVGIAGSLSLGALGGRLEDIFGDLSVEASLELDLDDRRICGAFVANAGLACEVSFCIGLQTWGDLELELGCGGGCAGENDAYCGEGASCEFGVCVGQLPDGAPCYSDSICESEHCGSILRDLTCQDQVTGVGVECLGVCFTPGSAALGEVCWDDAQCDAGTCEGVAPIGGLSVLNRCECSPGDCEANEFCSPITGECHPKKPSGNSLLQNACLDSSECLSGNCRLGFCSCTTCAGTGNFCATIDNTLLPSNVCEAKREAGRTCVRDAACTSDNCVAGFCGECKGNSGCASDEFCNGIGKCLRKLSPGLVCAADNQCASNRCRQLGNTPVKQCVECETHGECGSDKFCDPVLRRCEPKRDGPAPCLEGAQCKSGRCNAGLCGCSADNQCAGAFWCRDGRDCFPDFPFGSPCSRNQQCLGGRCNLDGSPDLCVPCTQDSHCPAGWCGQVGGLAACLPDLLPLIPCSRNSQCVSGTCRERSVEVFPDVRVNLRLCD